jgi:hypothetical protein
MELSPGMIFAKAWDNSDWVAARIALKAERA